jgi:hypothetical protein
MTLITTKFLILEDRRISAKSIAEQLGISHEQFGSTIHEDLDMLVACFLPGRAKDLSAPLYIHHQFNIHKFHVLPTHCIYVIFCGSENKQ